MANLDLSKYGITGVTEILHNPSYDVLFAEETKPGLEGFEKGQVTELGAVNVMTGVYTGRSPKDKFFVKNEASENSVWWTSEEYKNDNKPCSEEAWADLKAKAVKELSNKRLFVVDTFCGANEGTRMKVRFIMEVAWQAHFVTNMFIRPTAEELANYGEPDFVCFNASKAKVDNYKELGLNSETATVFNLKTKEQVILNTWYGGEMKKGMFSIMNYMNPLRGIASMHCSANTDMEGTSSAIFFGLSGTGKTTLSTDPKRKLIGDDEHGWDNEGVFNYEGGCYAKVINLDKESEPDIFNAIKRDALLENVTVAADGKINFADKSVTENTRKLLLRLFLSSTLLFLQNFRVLIRRSLILVILTLILHSGMKKQKTLPVASSRTSLSSLETKLVRSWLLLVRNSNQTKLTTLNNRKATLQRVAFLFLSCTAQEPTD